MNKITNLSYGEAKINQMLNSFVVPLSDNIEKGHIGKLDTSHLVLKPVMVGGKLQNRWVDPTNGKEHAQHGSRVKLEHKGKEHNGTIGAVLKSGEYSIKLDNGLSVNKHTHQFDSPHAIGASKVPAAKIESRGEHPNIEGHAIDKSELEELDAEGDDEDIDINKKFDIYAKYVRMVAKGFIKSGIAYGKGGVGKAQPLYSKVLTPTGFKTMGEIDMGDQVVTPEGNIVNVLAVFPQGIRPVYELTFIDGSKARCDENHLWKIWDRRYTAKGSGEWKIYTTKQLVDINNLKGTDKRGKDGKGWGWRFGVPFIEKVFQTKDIKLPIHPYLLGFLLGDGCFRNELSFSTGIREKVFLLTKLCKLLPKGLKIKKRKSSLVESGTASYGISQINLLGGHGFGPTKNILIESLREFDLFEHLSQDKFVPEIYKQASPKQKLEMIQGLMDSDGYVRNDGQTSFGSTSEQLTKDFIELVKSFGGFASFKAGKEGKFYDYKGGARQGRVSYGVAFNLPEGLTPVTVPFKAERYKNKKHYAKALSIVDIQYIGEEETKCILIDDPEHLYITDDYIVTHNTWTALNTLKHLKNPKTGANFVEFDPETHMAEVDPEDKEDAEDDSVFTHSLVYDKDAYDYVKITGKATTSGIIQAMWEHNGKLLLFDDCDTALTQPDTIMMFKGALDSTGDSKISSLSARPLKDSSGNPIPSTFKFNGRAFFISNLRGNQIDQAIKSRSLRINLTMTVEQTLERIKQIAKSKNGKLTNIELFDTDNELIPYTHEDMDEAIKFIEKYKNKVNSDELNIRTLGNIVRLIHDSREEGEDENEWRLAARSFIMSKAVESELEKSEEDGFEKGGIGSKGGKVIGHTKSGKPIYQNRKADHEKYKEYGYAEHQEAAKTHYEFGENLGAGADDPIGASNLSKKKQEHYRIARSHEKHFLNVKDDINKAFDNILGVEVEEPKGLTEIEKAFDDMMNIDLEKGGVGSGKKGHKPVFRNTQHEHNSKQISSVIKDITGNEYHPNSAAGQAIHEFSKVAHLYGKNAGTKKIGNNTFYAPILNEASSKKAKEHLKEIDTETGVDWNTLKRLDWNPKTEKISKAFDDISLFDVKKKVFEDPLSKAFDNISNDDLFEKGKYNKVITVHGKHGDFQRVQQVGSDKNPLSSKHHGLHELFSDKAKQAEYENHLHSLIEHGGKYYKLESKKHAVSGGRSGSDFWWHEGATEHELHPDEIALKKRLHRERKTSSKLTNEKDLKNRLIDDNYFGTNSKEKTQGFHKIKEREAKTKEELRQTIKPAKSNEKVKVDKPVNEAKEKAEYDKYIAKSAKEITTEFKHFDYGENTIKTLASLIQEKISRKAVLKKNTPISFVDSKGKKREGQWGQFRQWVLAKAANPAEAESKLPFKDIQIKFNESNLSKSFGEDIDIIEKFVGAGSRGGKVLGYTKSGKPIYEDKNHEHTGFTKHDHLEAADFHEDLKAKHLKAYNKTTKEIAKLPDHKLFTDEHQKLATKEDNHWQNMKRNDKSRMFHLEHGLKGEEVEKSNKDEIKRDDGWGNGAVVLGATKSKKPIYANADNKKHKEFDYQDHKDAYTAHGLAAVEAHTEMGKFIEAGDKKKTDAARDKYSHHSDQYSVHRKAAQELLKKVKEQEAQSNGGDKVDTKGNKTTKVKTKMEAKSKDKIEKAFDDLLSSETIEKAEFDTKERKKLAKEGQAEKGGSYPIRNASDLANAIKAIGRSKNPEATKRWIKKRAKELDKEDMLPASWGKSSKVEKCDKELTLSKAFDNLLNDSFEKGGEGTRGGKIIGYTKSGKPIYDEANHEAHKDFTLGDHNDAYKLHNKLSNDAVENHYNNSENAEKNILDDKDNDYNHHNREKFKHEDKATAIRNKINAYSHQHSSSKAFPENKEQHEKLRDKVGKGVQFDGKEEKKMLSGLHEKAGLSADGEKIEDKEKLKNRIKNTNWLDDTSHPFYK